MQTLLEPKAVQTRFYFFFVLKFKKNVITSNTADTKKKWFTTYMG